MAAEERRDEIKAFEKQVNTWKIPGDDELLKCLKAKLLSDLEESVELFHQCKSMERLGSPKELSQKISRLPETCEFYIGYTKAIDRTYLWTTSPKSVEWEERCSAGEAPAKTHTYFTHLNENDDLTEDALIRKWKEKKKEQCLNRKTNGKKTKKGIVYLLVYEDVDPREDVDRLCQELKEGDMNDKAFREQIQQVQKVLGRQPEEESDSESDDGPVTESPAS